MRSNVLQYGPEWSDGVRFGLTGSDWVLSHTHHVKPISAYTLGNAQFRMKSLVGSLFSRLPQINVKLDTKNSQPRTP